jgi:YggT family protein
MAVYGGGGSFACARWCSISKIAGPGDGPAMRGGLRPCSALGLCSRWGCPQGGKALGLWRNFPFGAVVMLTIIQALLVIIGVVRLFVIVHFIMSWLIRFDVLNLRQQFVAQVWYTLQRILEPLYGPIRRALPDMGGIDLSPVIVLVGLEILRIFLINNIPAFL